MSASIPVAHAATPSPLPTRLLGQTGVTVTLFGLGGEGVLRTYDRTAEAVRAVIPGKPSSPVITVSSVLAFRKHRCENAPPDLNDLLFS